MDRAAPVCTSDHCRKLSGVLNIVGDKWTVMVVRALIEHPRRFNDIKRTIGGISQQMLTRTLKALERDGMVRRTVHPTVPPQVEYALTVLGHSLALPLRELGAWAGEHIEEIERNRLHYDVSRGVDVGR
ncbi:winged helix-turn-helix transcriptional regulator [Sphingomonas sp. S2-65]|uniref:winged helix-turn-helix transcriptional regulator n=1 Tax=Sphingomonas sp. S2-65 TaxID=2903960 RepID=UPI001F27BD7F|nr:helix-turn-helix domain-containing protein [Sphingomonas sp. S2-65]UYY58654.1 helix-turn-helix transcriptional regulator [Sphingomonas sp. S2-65]